MLSSQLGVTLRLPRVALLLAILIPPCGPSMVAAQSTPKADASNPAHYSSQDVKTAYAELVAFSECNRGVERDPKLFPNPVRKRPSNPGEGAVSTVHHALTVPVAALVPAPSGEYHVQVVDRGKPPRDVPLSIGDFDIATGRVPVTGSPKSGQHVILRYAAVIDHGGAYLAIPQIFHLQSRAFRQAAAECGSERLKLGL